jgi:N-acetylmuramoyl-L-alanine amidase
MPFDVGRARTFISKDLFNHEPLRFIKQAKMTHYLSASDQFEICKAGISSRQASHCDRINKPAISIKSLFLLLLLSLFSFFSTTASHAQSALNATSAQITGDERRVEAVIKFDREPKLSRLIISNPHRLVIDLPETGFQIDGKTFAARGLISDVRYGMMQEGKSRIVVTAKGPFALDLFEVSKDESSGSWTLQLGMSVSTEMAFEKLLDAEAERTGATAVAAKADRIGQAPTGRYKTFTVMIDAGHGGIDIGARGRSGTQEKDITLAFATELKNLLSQNPSLRVVMTRNSDEFLALGERVRLARQNEADIFIAIHADTIRMKDLRGATVYTISDKASDEVAHAVAANENQSDIYAGLPVASDNNDVSDILIDLMRRETQKFSVNLAKTVVSSFTGKIRLINNPHRSAGFLVLKAPDVPSVLVELGYLSNPQDEKLLNTPKWRTQTAKLLVTAIEAYAATHATQVANQ